MLRSAFVSFVVLCVAYAVLNVGKGPSASLPSVEAQQFDYIPAPGEKVIVREDGSLQICTATSCRIIPASQPVMIEDSSPSDVVVSSPMVVAASCGGVAVSSCGGVASVNSLSSGHVYYRQPVRRVVRGSARVVATPVRFVRNRQPVRSVLRRVFCR